MIRVLPASDKPHPTHQEIEASAQRTYRHRVNAPIWKSDVLALARALKCSQSEVVELLQIEAEMIQ